MLKRVRHLQRDTWIAGEMLAQFIRCFLMITPPLPKCEREGAEALGRERYVVFVRQIARRIGSDKSLITESLDRLSRSQADIAALYERLQFLGVRIETLADGAVSEIHVGLKGTMSALFLKDLAQKTRRGQIGRVKAGRIPGGKSFGYEVIKDGDDRGRRAISPTEADIVRRIFREYATGKGPLAIVRDLNYESVPGLSGRHWNASALLGSLKRRNGILNNELYVGQIVYNRQRFLKDPASGKRIAREPRT